MVYIVRCLGRIQWVPPGSLRAHRGLCATSNSTLLSGSVSWIPNWQAAAARHPSLPMIASAELGRCLFAHHASASSRISTTETIPRLSASRRLAGWESQGFARGNKLLLSLLQPSLSWLRGFSTLASPIGLAQEIALSSYLGHSPCGP